MSTGKLERDSDVSRIGAVRAAWIAAVKDSDIDRLVALATDDVVVVHGDGRCVCGKEALRVELLKDFGLFDVDERDSSTEIMVHDKWALEFCEMDRTVMAIRGGTQVQAHSRVLTVFGRQVDASWKVARVIGLPD